jgi:phosphate transport system protein
MERHFDEQLFQLKSHLVRMCAVAETMIHDAIKALVSRDPSHLKSIPGHESEVNGMQLAIDETCFTLIALHQPAAADLRFILGAAKTCSELERLADLAVNIGEKTEHLLQQPELTPFVIVPRMSAIATGMVKDSLHAYVNRDTEKAFAIFSRDDELDDLCQEMTDKMSEFMASTPACVPRALDLILIARHLERIGDHATNIAENAIFVADGRDVRHHHAEDPGAPVPL